MPLESLTPPPQENDPETISPEIQASTFDELRTKLISEGIVAVDSETIKALKEAEHELDSGRITTAIEAIARIEYAEARESATAILAEHPTFKKSMPPDGFLVPRWHSNQ
jgi:hypothetical protein